ncbi:MAG: ABC transporter ATP-binding protein [Syntrophales bacterium]|nr:ABC transporter ATP-binding protein [Syntrophales bacterium]
MITLKNLTKRYGNLLAVSDLNLSVARGEIFGFIGPNGAGKTTTVETIVGLNKNASGTVTFLGENILGQHPYDIFKKGLALVPEKREIFPKMPVIENLLLGACNPSLTEKNLTHIYSLFPILQEREQQMAGTLSGGEQQMLAVGRALMGSPKLIMLDEPSLGLAPLLVKEVFEIIRTINEEGKTVLLVEQNAYAALKIADVAYVLEVGSIVLSGTGDELLRNPKVREAYLGG